MLFSPATLSRQAAKHVLNSPNHPLINHINASLDSRLLDIKRDFKYNSIINKLSLSNQNDPELMLQTQFNSLPPDSLFLCVLIGNDSLFQLRSSLQLAQIERSNGFSNCVLPMMKSSDVSNLLTKVGFNLVTIDVEQVSLVYPTPFDLMDDLNHIGLSNSLNDRRNLNRDVLVAADAVYRSVYSVEDGVEASFDLIYGIGWSPSDSQVKPKERGSAKISLKSLGEV